MQQNLGKLADATNAGFRSVIDMGYRLHSGEPSGRGESVDLVSDLVRIAISADWLEGEVEVQLQTPGQSPVPLESVVDLTKVRGLHLRRISRSVTREQLSSTLTKVAEALIEQAADVLAATPEGLARLGA